MSKRACAVCTISCHRDFCRATSSSKKPSRPSISGCLTTTRWYFCSISCPHYTSRVLCHRVICDGVWQLVKSKLQNDCSPIEHLDNNILTMCGFLQSGDVGSLIVFKPDLRVPATQRQVVLLPMPDAKFPESHPCIIIQLQ